MIPTEQLMNAALVSFLLAAVVTDLVSHRIPNRLVGAMLLTGLGCQAAVGGLAGLGTALGGMVVGFLVFILPYARRSVAAGDVKLMAAAGVYLGAGETLVAACLAMLAGAALGASLLFYRAHRSSERVDALLAMKFPYASAIAIGTCTAMFVTGAPWI